MEHFCHIPCGRSLPENNPHAISVNLPSISDVIRYEENDPEILEIMQSAYPRFRRNRLSQRVVNHIREVCDIPGDTELLPLSTENAVSRIEERTGLSLNVISHEGICLIKEKNDHPGLTDIKYFLQHTGMILSSRKAEDYLFRKKIVEKIFPEKAETAENAEQIIKQVLSDAYGRAEQDDIFLCASGTNAFYSAFDSIQRVMEKQGRNIFIRFGWLYMDSMEVIRKYSSSHCVIMNITDFDSLERYVAQNHSEVACIITEVPNNPLILTPDLPAVSALAGKYGIALAVDSSIGTPFNVEIMEFADIAIESLTKFACGNADMMMGAVLLNKESRIAQSVKDDLGAAVEAPYIRELQRMAEEIKTYGKRVGEISQNTHRFVSYLQSTGKIKKIHWALSSDSAENYRKIMKGSDSVPGLISVIFDKELYHYYDRLPLAKGPSFGTTFTLAMPYIYMAHYDLMKTEEGRGKLKSLGIDPEILRISIGLEPVDELINIFQEIFD